MKKILILCEKVSSQKRIEAYLESVGRYSECEIVFDYFGVVMDMRTVRLPFERRTDGIYLRGTLFQFSDLKLQDLEFPENSFIISRKFVAKNLREGFYLPSDIDEVICVVANPWFVLSGKCYVNPEGVLASKYFLEHFGMTLSNVSCAMCDDESKESLDSAFTKAEPFDDVFANVVDALDMGFSEGDTGKGYDK